MREKVEAALEKIRPALQADGGDIKLIDVTEDGVVQGVDRLLGLPMAAMTLKAGVERTLMSGTRVTGVQSVKYGHC